MTMTRRALYLVAAGFALAAAPALAQGKGEEGAGGAAVAFMLMPLLASMLQLLLSAVWPSAAHRLAGAWSAGRGATIGWGVLCAVLVLIVLAVLSMIGGPFGQGLAALMLIPILVATLAAVAGVSHTVGSWCLKRDGHSDQPTFISVLIGGLVITLLSWVPIFGWCFWLSLMIFAAGSIVRSTVGLPSVTPAPSPTPEEPDPE